MGLFSFTQEIAIDLGTANTIIMHNGKMVVDEPSVVALDKRTDKLLAVGEKARQMHGKTHENIRTIRPLRDGVIADFYAAEQMIRGPGHPAKPPHFGLPVIYMSRSSFSDLYLYCRAKFCIIIIICAPRGAG